MKPTRNTLQALSAAAALAATGIAGCDMGYHSNAAAPAPVATSGPTISYRYSAGQDLPRVRSEARAYCSSFDMNASLADVMTNDDGSRTARFDCTNQPVAFSGPAAPPPPVVVAPPVSRPPLVSYGFADSRQYAAAADNASRYCQSYGAGPREVNVVGNPNGTRTVTFSCDQPL